MPLRNLLAVLVYGLAISIVAFGVLMGAYGLATATTDAAAAKVLWWIAIGVLMIIVIDAILLLGILGLRAIENDDSRHHDPEP